MLSKLLSTKEKEQKRNCGIKFSKYQNPVYLRKCHSWKLRNGQAGHSSGPLSF